MIRLAEPGATGECLDVHLYVPLYTPHVHRAIPRPLRQRDTVVLYDNVRRSRRFILYDQGVGDSLPH